MRPFIPPEFQADIMSILFLVAVWGVIFGDDFADMIGEWFQRAWRRVVQAVRR